MCCRLPCPVRAVAAECLNYRHCFFSRFFCSFLPLGLALVVERCVAVMRAHLPYLMPDTTQLLSKPNHHDYAMRSLPNVMRFLLKQTAFRMADGPTQFQNIVSFVVDMLKFGLTWLSHDNGEVYEMLAVIFESKKPLYRVSSSEVVLDQLVIEMAEKLNASSLGWTDPSKIRMSCAWDHKNHRLVGLLVDIFGHLGGFDKLLERLQGRPLPLECLRAAVKMLQRVRVVAGITMVERIIRPLPAAVFGRQLLDLETSDLRRVTKKDIEDLDVAMRVVLRTDSAFSDRAEETCDEFCLAFALKCLRSPLQDKKFNGLQHIEESIESIARERKHVFHPPVQVSDLPKVERKVAALLTWLRENSILELVFQRDNMRRELIVLTKKTVRFLQQEGELSPAHVMILLEGILDHHHDKNRDVRDALYDTLIESSDRISDPATGRLIWNTVRRMDPARHFCSRTVRLLRSVIDGTREPAFALEVAALVWDMVQDSSRAPMDAILAALEALPRVADRINADLVPDCVALLQKRKSGVQALKLLWELVNRISNKQEKTDFAGQLIVDREVFTLAVDELSHYKRAAMARREEFGESAERDWDNEVLVGLFSHLEAVETRHMLLSKLTEASNNLPTGEYLVSLWKTAVETHLTQRECDQGLEWVVNMCISEPELAAGLFTNVALTSGVAQKIFTRSDTAFNTFMGLVNAVNHDQGMLRLKNRDQVLSFEEALNWPFVGVRELVAMLARDASAELWTRGQDIIINMHLIIAPSAAAQTDLFREGLADLIFEMLEQGAVLASLNSASDDVKWIDRLVVLLRSLVVLTKSKEEEDKSKEAAAVAAAAKEEGAPEEFDAAADAKKDAVFVGQYDRDKVDQFVEMMGAGFPEEFRWVMSALLLKEATWNLERAINDFFTDGDAKTANVLVAAKKYRRHVPDAVGGNGVNVQEAVPEPTKGTPVGELVGRKPHCYDVLFKLLDCAAVDREAIWALLKMLPPDARLTSLLSDELANGAVAWETVLGDKASYQLLYSLELVRQKVPGEEDSEDSRLVKSEWCRTFVHRGGFAYLFALLSRIARLDARGHIERACLGHLLRIVFFFTRAELDTSLAASQENELRLSTVTAQHVVEGAPFDELGALMFHLLTERNRHLEEADGRVEASVEAEEAEVARFAVYLLAGALRKRPLLLQVLVETEKDFGARLCGLLCSSDSALGTHMGQQLSWLVREFPADGGGAKVTPRSYLSRQLLAWVPGVLGNAKQWSHCAPLFTLLLTLRSPSSLHESPPAWAPNGLGPAVSQLIATRAPGREGAVGVEDQALAGLFCLAASLVQEAAGESDNVKLMETVLGGCLFAGNGGCVATATRRAGLELCAVLGRSSREAWEYAVRLLGAWHAEQEPFSSWRPVEGAAEVRRSRYVGLRNCGATCYMNATLQQLFMMPELRNAVLAAEVPTEQREAAPGDPAGMLWQFQRLQAALLHSASSWADTEPFVRTLRDGMGDTINQARQEDAYDFLTRFQEQLEVQMSKCPNMPDQKVFQKMFSVEMCQEIECSNGHAKATAQEAEPVLQVDFAPTIEAALDSTFGLGGDPISDYRCDGCGGKVDICKRHMIHRASDQLVVMLRRFEWDYFAVGGNTRKKLQGNFEIPHHLNLSPFTEAGIKQRRLGREPVMSDEWEYELRGIVVHSGRTMDSGHYYSIIRDLDTGEWFKYDDRDVTPFPLENLHEGNSHFIGECYMLLFQRASVDLTKSQQLLHSQSIVTVDGALLREVDSGNARLVAQRRFQERAYFSFLQELLSDVTMKTATPDDSYDLAWSVMDKDALDKGAVVSLKPEFEAARMAALCVWEPWTRGRQAVGERRQEILKEWVEVVLEPRFAASVPAAAWAARELLGPRSRWLRYFLLECEDRWVREGFARWLLAVLNSLARVEYAQGLFRDHPMADEKLTNAQIVQTEPIGLAGQLLDALMGLMESSRAHWRRFHQYWILLRDVAAATPGARLHLACGVYPSYAGRPMRILTMFVDYFMGEFSPFTRELPRDKQDRAVLGNKMGGESADLTDHFWAMQELVRAFDTGAPGERPEAVSVQTTLSATDVSMWRRADMMGSLVKQGYNPEATGLIVAHFVWEHKGWTDWFNRLLQDALFKDMQLGVWTVVLGVLRVSDSMQPLRAMVLLGDGAHQGALSLLRERRNFHQASVAAMLVELGEIMVDFPVIAAYMRHVAPVWQPWLTDFCYTYNYKDAKATARILSRFDLTSLDGGGENIDWDSLLLEAGDATETETEQADDDDDDDDDIIIHGGGSDSPDAMLVDDDDSGVEMLDQLRANSRFSEVD